VLVSLSRDGDIQARALSVLGLAVRRGSTSRGGARGLAALVRLLRSGLDAAFAVDGPRGPWGTVHPGALAAARHAGGVLIPLGCASSSAWVLRGSWDRFELPKPFARVVVAVGPALDVAGLDAESATGQVGQAIHACIQEAHRALSQVGSPVVVSRGRGGQFPPSAQPGEGG
jgi:lysophospholipid acyltransferase (LPLAT)-like uncharacterized protein